MYFHDTLYFRDDIKIFELKQFSSYRSITLNVHYRKKVWNIYNKIVLMWFYPELCQMQDILDEIVQNYCLFYALHTEKVQRVTMHTFGREIIQRYPVFQYIL